MGSRMKPPAVKCARCHCRRRVDLVTCPVCGPVVCGFPTDDQAGDCSPMPPADPGKMPPGVVAALIADESDDFQIGGGFPAFAPWRPQLPIGI